MPKTITSVEELGADAGLEPGDIWVHTDTRESATWNGEAWLPNKRADQVPVEPVVPLVEPVVPVDPEKE